MGDGEKPNRGILDREGLESKALPVTTRSLHVARERAGVLTTEEVQGGINGLLMRTVFAVVKDMGNEGPDFGPTSPIRMRRVAEAIAAAGGETNKQMAFLVIKFAEEIRQILLRPEVYMAADPLPVTTPKEGEEQ